ncbi:formylmethanofuran dehydrogenase subunit C [Methanotorris igneus]|uniref:formylmethanofuran dehydrogenase n=1 Tax=Methanotorris igneus (strain DSM 5666 / JCM 11834 / Kol 5) TaxID=880724 RepID=F6BAR3_METIK|nr:formylmethanofuran dehydrogenase subunit C [Methanotorris igneus]AEF95877.1 formylmethanofuran dehydrogenase subunit C [Methanotorris igneus Kol 5]
MQVILTPKETPDIPIEADVITPDNFANKSKEEIESLMVWQGPNTYPLSEFFDVEVSSDDSEDVTIIIEGDVKRVKYIGYKMTSGKIIINGNVGIQLGSEMKGGEIVVNGNAGNWVGREMKGGLIKINGNAGDYVGSAYRGSWYGMKGGKIIVEGNAGNNVGGGLSGGEIIIKGNVGQFCGIRQSGGFIYIGGNAERAVGVEMSKGDIVVCGRIRFFAPGFEFANEEVDININGMQINGEFLKFVGDYAIKRNPKGKLYALKEKNLGLIEPELYECYESHRYDGGIKALLNTGSTIVQGEIIKGGKKFTEKYVKECAVCYIHPKDYAYLGKPKYVKVFSEDRKSEICLKAIPDDSLQEGTVFIPRSIWANVVISSYTEAMGSPLYKGCFVFVEPVKEAKILSAEEIMKRIYG